MISYNQEASQVALTGESQVDKASIDKIRASGSTSFVAVFKHLSAIFKDKTEDVFFSIFSQTNPEIVFHLRVGMRACKEMYCASLLSCSHSTCGRLAV